MSKKVYAFDPGKTTGYIILDVTLFQGKRSAFNVELATVIGWDHRCQHIKEALQRARLDHECNRLEKIIIEEFRLFPNKADPQSYSEMPSPRVIGVIEAYCNLWSLDKYIKFQTPSQHAQVKTIPRDLPAVTHIRSAYKHALYYTIMRDFEPVKIGT